MTFPHYKQLDQMDCGPTCLRMVAKHYGRHYTAQTLREKAHKKVNGRKRQLLVDSSGRLWFARFHAANLHDGAALRFIPDIVCQKERMVKIYGDQAYAGVFADEIEKYCIKFEKAARPESTKGFEPAAGRWVVERTIAWLNFFRRIVKDYEYTVSSSVGWMYLANIQIVLQQIHP